MFCKYCKSPMVYMEREYIGGSEYVRVYACYCGVKCEQYETVSGKQLRVNWWKPKSKRYED